MNPAKASRLPHAADVLLVGLAAVLLSAAGCREQLPPLEPLVGGTTTGQPDEAVRVWARSRDPNNDYVDYYFDWGDSSAENWTAEHASGDTAWRAHVYESVGSYAVRVRARDRGGLESGWSAAHGVDVAFEGPFTPGPPTGPVLAYPDTMVRFSVHTGHSREDSVAYQFDWGDTTGGWSGYVRPGETLSDSHAYSATGQFAVRARARDRAGNTSPWSGPTDVRVEPWPLRAPRSLALAQSDGINVMLRWDTGRNGDSVRYGIWFRPADGDSFGYQLLVPGGRAVHDPQGKTGWYTVSSVRDTEVLFAPETVSTVPVFTDTVILSELNAPGRSGCGWSRTTGIGEPFRMQDSANSDSVDCYFTDQAPGYTGPSYWLASPHLGPGDPGGSVPEADWRDAGLVTLWGNGQDPLPAYDSLLYENTVFVAPMDAFYGLYTPDGHYVLIRTLEYDPSRGTVPMLSWFQLVKGLRILYHPEVSPD